MVQACGGDDGCSGGLCDGFLKVSFRDSGLLGGFLDTYPSCKSLCENDFSSWLVDEGLGSEVGDFIGLIDSYDDVVRALEPAFADAKEDNGEVVCKVGAEDEGVLRILKRLDGVIDR